MTAEEIKATTLEEALERLEKLALGNDEILFRGHSQSSWRICSTLSRYSVIPHQSWDSRLDEMLSHFLTNLRSIGELPSNIEHDRRARLEYGRHYGVPSPLIDFTLSPYVALFFAFNGVRHEPKQVDETVTVYALNVSTLGLEWAKLCIAGTSEEDPMKEFNRFMYERDPLFETGYPGGILKFIRFPASWNKRMQRQMGVFIYDSLDHAGNGKKDFEDFISGLKETPDQDGNSKPILTKLHIPRSAAGNAFSRLELMGINATRLYDDHEGAARDVYNSYSYNRKTGYAWDLRMSPPDRSVSD